MAAALVVGAAWYRFSETYVNTLKAFGFEGPGVVNVEQLKREAPDSVKHWQTEHARPDNPDYWQTLQKQISTLWWTPLGYGMHSIYALPLGAIFDGPFLKGIKWDTRTVEVDTLEAIRKRRSIRRYTDDAIPKADLETIVDAGRLAATGSNR